MILDLEELLIFIIFNFIFQKSRSPLKLFENLSKVVVINSNFCNTCYTFE